MTRRARGARAVTAAVLVVAGLVAVYIALGGGRYETFAVADPCHERPWRTVDGTSEVAEQAALTALDTAACRLGVTREEMTRALAGETERDAFARRHGFTDAQVDDAVRAGLRRAIARTEDAGKLNRVEAFLLRQAADRLPIDRVIAAVRDGDLSLSDLTP